MIGRVYLNLYEVTALIGAGSMGQVFLARNRSNRQSVALKIMHEQIARQARFRLMFKRETDCLIRFKHPNAVILLDAAEDPHGSCLVMEHLRGADLEQLRKRLKRFKPDRLGRLLGQLCDVLHAAHGQGIIHRDLKPSNIMVLDWDTPLERIKVLDFGLAQLAETALERPTSPGQLRTSVTGAPGYACPERIRGAIQDARSDVYSIGILLYELLTGRMPFLQASVAEVLRAHVNDAPPPFPSELQIPKGIEALVMKCLAKDPAKRPQSAWELAKQLEYALGTKIMQEAAPARPAAASPAREAVHRPNPQTMPGLRPNPQKQIRPTLPGTQPSPQRPDRGTMPGEQAVHDSNELSYLIPISIPDPAALARLGDFVDRLKGKVMEKGPQGLRAMLALDLYNAVLGASTRSVSSGSSAQILLTEMEFQLAGPVGSREVRLVLRPLGTVPMSLAAAWRSSGEQIHSELRDWMQK